MLVFEGHEEAHQRPHGTGLLVGPADVQRSRGDDVLPPQRDRPEVRDHPHGGPPRAGGLQPSGGAGRGPEHTLLPQEQGHQGGTHLLALQRSSHHPSTLFPSVHHDVVGILVTNESSSWNI